MLKKLLKYDLGFIGRYWWIAMLTVVFLSGGAAVSMRVYQEKSIIMDFTDVDLIIQTFSYVVFMLCAVGAGLCITAIAILICIRYFKHLFTDEGYLTFTLPVSREQIFVSKLISAVSWMGISVAILFLCIVVVILISIPTTDKSILAFDKYKLFYESAVKDFERFGGWRIAQGVLSLIASFSSIVLSISVVYFCITLGATVVKKAKIVVSIGIYYLLNMIYSSVIMTAGLVFLIFVAFGVVDVFASASAEMLNAALTAGIFAIFAIQSTMAALFCCATRNILERKLNLA